MHDLNVINRLNMQALADFQTNIILNGIYGIGGTELSLHEFDRYFEKVSKEVVGEQLVGGVKSLAKMKYYDLT